MYGRPGFILIHHRILLGDTTILHHRKCDRAVKLTDPRSAHLAWPSHWFRCIRLARHVNAAQACRYGVARAGADERGCVPP